MIVMMNIKKTVIVMMNMIVMVNNMIVMMNMKSHRRHQLHFSGDNIVHCGPASNFAIERSCDEDDKDNDDHHHDNEDGHHNCDDVPHDNDDDHHDNDDHHQDNDAIDDNGNII